MQLSANKCVTLTALCTALSVLFNPPPVTGQQATVQGTISLPATKVKQRTFRGSEYRNRLSTGSRAQKKKPKKKSPFESAVVSAHPLSFEPELKRLDENPRMDQMDVTFQPRVLPITVGSQVDFVNYDNVYHNVFSLTPGADFDIGRVPTGKVVSQTVDKSGEIELFCDIHPQMNATILSLDTPYFVRPNSTGAYALAGLPPGMYEIRLYHPDFEAVAQQLELGPNQTVTKDFVVTE